MNFHELQRMNPTEREALCNRIQIDLRTLTPVVQPLVDQVQDSGDRAVRALTARFDGVDLDPSLFRVSRAELSTALDLLPESLRKAMEVSTANIRKFHERQREASSWEMEIAPGIRAGEKVYPIPSVGLYVPRGKGSFPSMMMMAAVPALVSGVQRIAVVTPPDREGKPDSATLAAAELLGVTEVYRVGGVQAIAALAFGTESIPKVAKILGPGSAYVLAAKHLVAWHVDVGIPAGPSETIVLADQSVDPMTAVKDLLIEAEHGADSSAYLVTPEPSVAESALALIPTQVDRLPHERRSFCREVLGSSGGVILARDMEDAIDFINEFAPEHLQILTSNPEQTVEQIRYAGEALLGVFTPSTLANYSIGPNAILPTSRFARTCSSLSVHDFTRRMSVSMVSQEGFANLAPISLELANYEGFPAHAEALKHRMRGMH